MAKPLSRFVTPTAKGEGRRKQIVKYEKIPFYCQVYGLMGAWSRGVQRLRVEGERQEVGKMDGGAT